MALIAFELSGEHPDIPEAEVIGALESEEIGFSVRYRFDQILIVDILIANANSNINENASVITKLNANIDQVSRLNKRLALTWHIINVLGISDSTMPGIMNMVENVVFQEPSSLTYKVRAKKIKRKSPISSEDIERKIGEVLYNKGYSADLVYPDVRYRAVLTDGKCIFGRVLASVDRGSFEDRKPQNKPFFYPGVLMPRLARSLVNIARIRPGSIILDPYCGTGGILVEAGLIGAVTLGCDVQWKILLGARMNLDFYVPDHFLMFQDAGNMALKDSSIDCVVTDPPYGRSALIQARSLDNLMKRSLCEIFRVLRPGGRAVVVSECPVEEWAESAGFSVVDVYIQRVHRSLTRRITVLDKI
jgi:tRNA (guanine10-N2)-dimethyltransferase